MNVFRDLCTPFLEGLADQVVIDLVVPNDSGVDLQSVIDCGEEDGENVGGSSVKGSVKRITDVDGCKGYAQLLAVIALVVELKADNRTVSLRDVYYALKSLFRDQRECNACILQVGRMLKLKRHEMNIIPASKGLLSGPLRFRFHSAPTHDDDSRMDTDGSAGSNADWDDLRQETCQRTSSGASTVPSWVYAGVQGEARGEEEATPVLIGNQWTCTPAECIEVEWTGAGPGTGGPPPRWLVVVEKEGVFHRLVEEGFPRKINCVLVTGCGYPDIATRSLVSKLSALFPTMRVVGLCDYNPHGLALLLSYRFPSAAAGFESAGLQADMQWLGLRAAHLREFCERGSLLHQPARDPAEGRFPSGPIATPLTATRGSAFAQAHLQELTQHDCRKIRSLLHSIEQDSSHYHALLPEEYADELRQMLLGGVKCEIESCYALGMAFLPAFLERCLVSADFI